MLMSVNNESRNQRAGTTLEKTLPAGGVDASLFNDINLDPVSSLGEVDGFEDYAVMAETSANARVTAAVQVFMQYLQKSSRKWRSWQALKVIPDMYDVKDPSNEKYNYPERVELRYEKITWTYKDGNIIHSDSWNERGIA